MHNMANLELDRDFIQVVGIIKFDEVFMKIKSVSLGQYFLHYMSIENVFIIEGLVTQE